MPNYMLMLYAPEVGPAEQAQREAELPMWFELNDSLREAGLLVANGRLHAVASATTVRVRDGETELIDGPFAVTKEVLAGYYVLDCGDLDEALRQAARVPLARYGSVEVRPIMPVDLLGRPVFALSTIGALTAFIGSMIALGVVSVCEDCVPCAKQARMKTAAANSASRNCGEGLVISIIKFLKNKITTSITQKA